MASSRRNGGLLGCFFFGSGMGGSESLLEDEEELEEELDVTGRFFSGFGEGLFTDVSFFLLCSDLASVVFSFALSLSDSASLLYTFSLSFLFCRLFF